MTTYLQERRKLALLLPVVVVPCLTLLFFALGGGRGTAGATAVGVVRGVNMSLPMAQLDNKKAPDKLQLYAKAAADSAKLLEQQKQDPYAAGHGGGAADSGKYGLGAGAHGLGGGQYGMGAGQLGSGAGQQGLGAGQHGLQLGLDGRQQQINATADQVMARVEALKKMIAAQGVGSGGPAFGGAGGLGGPGVSGPWVGQEMEGDRYAGWQNQRAGGLSSALTAGREPSTPRRDPEMERIDGMLDKLIRIQHPEFVASDTGERGPVGRVLLLTVPLQEEAVRSLGQGGPGAGSVSRSLPQGNASAGPGTPGAGYAERGLGQGISGAGYAVRGVQQGTPGTSGAAEASGFMEIGETDRPDTARRPVEEALEAVIAADQTVMSGSTVALRLARAGSLDGILVPAGQLLYGEASISGERLKLHITSVRVGSLILPVDIQVYDLDGLAGIRVPGAMSRDVSKESAAEAMSGLGLASMDPSLTGQAANAGLQLAKSLASRKVRAVRVAVPAGYRVLLRNVKSGI